MTSVTFNEKVDAIYYNAFQDCTGLTDVYFETSVGSGDIATTAFKNCSNATVHLCDGFTTRGVTVTCQNWRNYFNDVKEVEGLQHVWGLDHWTWDGVEAATATFTCDYCHAEENLIDDAPVPQVLTEADCTNAGTTQYTATVTLQEVDYTDSKTVTTSDPTGHDWNDPVWTWDGESATATFVCKNDPTHVHTEHTDEVTSVNTPATCEEDGQTVYTATVTLEGETYTGTKEEPIPATGHDWNDPVWTWDGESATAKFVCKNDASHVRTVDNAEVTSTTTPATCEENGKTVYTATVTLEGKTYTGTKEETVPAIGHDWDDPEWTWDGESATAKFVCKNDASHVRTVDNAEVTSATTPATCEEDGQTVYTATVTLEGETYTGTKEETVPATGHDWDDPVWTWNGDSATAVFTCTKDPSHKKPVAAQVTSDITPATCEVDGTGVYTATVTLEGETYTDQLTRVLPATGHDWDNGTWEWIGTESAKVTFVCRNDSAHTESVDAVITVEETLPTDVKAGKNVYTATAVFNDKEYTDVKTEIIPATAFVPVEGDGSEYDPDSNEELTVKFDRDGDPNVFSRFAKIVNVSGDDYDYTLTDSDYDATGEPLIIKLKPSYLKSLKPGKYTLTAIFLVDDEEVESYQLTFTIRESTGVSSVGTGESAALFTAAAVLLLLSGAAIGYVIIRRRKALAQNKPEV